MTNFVYDILIVGAGPVGLSMAKALTSLGLKIALIERQPLDVVQNPVFDGREIAITHRTKRIMQDLHQWQRLDDSQIHYLRKARVLNGESSFTLGFDVPKDSTRTIDTLGYLISNQHIRNVAYQSLANHFGHDVEPFFGVKIVGAETNANCASIKLDDGRTLIGQLLIGADSRLSFLRKALGISADMHDFGRTVMVFRTEHTLSNEEAAHEGFYYGKTLAVLPLGQFQSSMVITIDNKKVDEIKSLNKEQLAYEMESWLNRRLGKMTVTSEIHDYPLIGVHARSFYGNRFALVGDASVGMHPVTAHGYNLGMEGVEILSRLITKQVQGGKDIASPTILRHYSHTHSLKTRVMYHGTNSIVKLYTDDSMPAKALRHLGLRVSDGFFPIKKIITGQLTG